MSVFRWNKVVEKFETNFKNTFCRNGSKSTKAHFDNLPEEYRMIDGAREKWSTLALLDAMIFILNNDTMSTTMRRAFDQHRVLFECILMELKCANERVYFEIINEKNKSKTSDTLLSTNIGIDIKMSAHILNFAPLEFPWDTFENLTGSMLENAPGSKAKNRYLEMVCLLTSHEILTAHSHDMDDLIQLVVHRVLYVIDDSKIACTPPTTPRVSQRGHRHRQQRESDLADIQDVMCVEPPRSTRDSKEVEEQMKFKGGEVLSPVTSPSSTKHKRVPSLASSAPMKRPSVDLSVEAFAAAAAAAVSTSASSSPICTTNSTVTISLEENGEGDDLSGMSFHVRLVHMFGSTRFAGSASVITASDLLQQQEQSVELPTSASVATANMQAHLLSRAHSSVFPPFRGPPLGIPIPTHDERDVFGGDHSSGLTPTVRGMSLAGGSPHMQRMPPLLPPFEVIAPRPSERFWRAETTDQVAQTVRLNEDDLERLILAGFAADFVDESVSPPREVNSFFDPRHCLLSSGRPLVAMIAQSPVRVRAVHDLVDFVHTAGRPRLDSTDSSTTVESTSARWSLEDSPPPLSRRSAVATTAGGRRDKRVSFRTDSSQQSVSNTSSSSSGDDGDISCSLGVELGSLQWC